MNSKLVRPMSPPIRTETTGDHDYAAELRRAYDEVGFRTWQADDLLDANLAVSRALFEPESLVARRPRPKELEVVALLSGLPFSTLFCDALRMVQQRIESVVGETLHYWVSPENLGVEYCVFKWPDEPWRDESLAMIRAALSSIHQQAFCFRVGGIQLNPDGCIVAKGFDQDGAISGIRPTLRDKISFMPEKQSRWAHVPLGRILEPLGAVKFAALARLMRELRDQPIAETDITAMRLVHEHRWYMEQKTILEEYALSIRTDRVDS